MMILIVTIIIMIIIIIMDDSRPAKKLLGARLPPGVWILLGSNLVKSKQIWSNQLKSDQIFFNLI